MAVFPHKNSFCSIHRLTFSTSKQTFPRIAYLRQGGRLVNYDGTHNVKFLAEKLTKFESRSRQEGGANEQTGWRVDNFMSRQDDELQVFVGSKCFCNETFVWNKQPCYLEQNPTKVTAVVLNWFALVYALVPFVERAISSLGLKRIHAVNPILSNTSHYRLFLSIIAQLPFQLSSSLCTLKMQATFA